MPRHARPFAFVLLAWGLAVPAGCGRHEAPVVPVGGTVTLDGLPLPEGFLYFKTVGTGELERFEVHDGAFAGQALPGDRRVEVVANRPKSVVIDGATVVVPDNVVHASFNIDSTLTAQVTREGPNRFTFAVKTK